MRRTDPVADRQNCIQAIVLDLSGHLPFAFPANDSEVPNSCLWVYLEFLEDVLQVFVDGRHGYLEQFGDQGLRQPECLFLETTFDARPAVLRLVEKNLAFGRKQGH